MASTDYIVSINRANRPELAFEVASDQKQRDLLDGYITRLVEGKPLIFRRKDGGMDAVWFEPGMHIALLTTEQYQTRIGALREAQSRAQVAQQLRGNGARIVGH